MIRVVSAYCGRTRILDFDYLSLRSIPTTFCIPSLKKVMRKFAEKFHPGDSIGFAYGLHHDTAHLHAHLALCPRTAKGRYVGCSTSRYSRSKPKRQMDLIKSWFGRENAVGENPSIYRGNGSRGAIREARATIVLATQAYTSIHSP